MFGWALGLGCRAKSIADDTIFNFFSRGAQRIGDSFLALLRLLVVWGVLVAAIAISELIGVQTLSVIRLEASVTVITQ
jgi:hypothetical protein